LLGQAGEPDGPGYPVALLYPPRAHPTHLPSVDTPPSPVRTNVLATTDTAAWHDGPMADLWLTGDPEADRLLDTDPFALLIGMLLDQRFPMESPFAGAHKRAPRTGELD